MDLFEKEISQADSIQALCVVLIGWIAPTNKNKAQARLDELILDQKYEAETRDRD